MSRGQQEFQVYMLDLALTFVIHPLQNNKFYDWILTVGPFKLEKAKKNENFKSLCKMLKKLLNPNPGSETILVTRKLLKLLGTWNHFNFKYTVILERNLKLLETS